jgi:xylem cysteine proteinase
MNYLKVTLIVLALSLSNAFIKYTTENHISNAILKNFENGSMKDLFKVYHFIFSKTYDLNTEEGIQRYKNFKASVKKVKEFNAEGRSYFLGINQFSDMSQDEFRKNYLNFNLEKEMKNTKGLRITIPEPVGYTERNVDWSSSFDAAVSQGSCGSCWAFATVSAMQGNYQYKYPLSNFVKFSPQTLVSCDTRNYGCNGGWPTTALDWIRENGIAYEADYPYESGQTGQNGECKYAQLPDDKKNKVIEGYEEADGTRASFLTNLENGPLIIVVDAEGNGNFQSYAGGIMDSTMTCSNINHAIVMVGIVLDNPSATGPYYIARNSWGTSWGEKGYLRIYRRDSDQTCFMERYGIRPLVTSSPNPVPPPPAPKCAQIYDQCGFKGNSFEICNNSPSFGLGGKSESLSLGKFTSITLFNGEKCYGSYTTLSGSFNCFSSSVTWLTNWAKSAYVSPQTPPARCLWLYAEGCHSQLKYEYCGGDISDLSTIGWADQIGSIAMGPGIASYKIHTEKNYYGYSMTFTKSAMGIHPYLYKKVKALKVVFS